MSRDPNVQLKQMIAGVEQRMKREVAILHTELDAIKDGMEKMKPKRGRPSKQDVKDRVLP